MIETTVIPYRSQTAMARHMKSFIQSASTWMSLSIFRTPSESTLGTPLLRITQLPLSKGKCCPLFAAIQHASTFNANFSLAFGCSFFTFKRNSNPLFWNPMFVVAVDRLLEIWYGSSRQVSADVPDLAWSGNGKMQFMFFGTS